MTKQELEQIIDDCEIESIDELKDIIHEHCDVIYYSNAIEYLATEDPSLNESMGLAAEMGYTPDSLDSEVLATLLKTERAREAIDEYYDDLEEYIEEREV